MTTTIVIGMDMADASAYAAKHHPDDELILVTPKSPYGARGRSADRVVTTRAADALSNIAQLLAEVHPAIVTQREPIGLHSALALDIRLLFSQLSTMQRDWQDAIGFGEEGRFWRQLVDDAAGGAVAITPEMAEAALRNYYIAKLALIDTETSEAIEEIRHNRGISERYYSVHVEPSDQTNLDLSFGANVVEQARERGIPVKPEGVPSELADIVIRCLSLAGEIGLDLGEAIVEKLNYNATQAQRHGGKAI